MKCRHHPESLYVQTEATSAPDFLFVDVDGKTKSHDIIKEDGTRASNEGEITGEVTDLPPTPGQRLLRNVYLTLTGELPDNDWTEQRLAEEIEEWQINSLSNTPSDPLAELESAGEGNLTVNPDDPTLEPDKGGEIVAGIPAGKEPNAK